VRSGDDEHLAQSGQHEQAERVVNHRLVISRQQLFADGQGKRVQSGARTAGEDEASHFRGKQKLGKQKIESSNLPGAYESGISGVPRAACQKRDTQTAFCSWLIR